MLVLYGNIFKVTRNRLPADVRLRCAASVGRELRAECSQMTTGTPLVCSVTRQSTMTRSTPSRVQRQAIRSESSSTSSNGAVAQSGAASRQASGRNSECFEMMHVDEERQTTSRPNVQCPHGRPTPASKYLRVWRFSNSPAEYRSTPAADDWRRTAGLAAGEGAARRENKAAKTLAIVVGGFVVCWLPFFMLYVVEPFCSACRVSDAVRSALTWLGYANSLVNPFIYATYNRHFRHSFWRLTVGRCYACLPGTHRRNNVIETPVSL